MLHRLILALALVAGVSALGPSAAEAQAVDVVQVCGASSGVVSPPGPGGRLTRDVNGQLCVTGGGGGGSGGTGGSAANPTYTTPAGITRTRLSCTLPAYTAGGNSVCTDQAGNQTTTTCAANTACQILPANANRKTFFIQNRTSGVTVDYGYTATVAPGLGIGADGTSTTNGQGAGFGETPAHVGTYYAAAPSAATITVVQGQ